MHSPPYSGPAFQGSVQSRAERFDSPAISIIVISRNEGEYLRSTISGLTATVPANTEMIVVDDGSVDSSADFLSGDSGARLLVGKDLGVARARNLGARQATGDMLVFADAHISVPSGWWKPLWEALTSGGADAVAPGISMLGKEKLKGYGLTLAEPDLDADWLPLMERQPYAVPILPGAFLAMSRKVFNETGGFDEGLLSRGGVDNELCLRLWLLGYTLLIVPEIEVGHLFRFEAPVAVPWAALLHNRLRLTFAHLSSKRVRRVVQTLQEHNDFASALSLTVDSDVFARRVALRARRLHDDDWFFNKFHLHW